MITYRMTTIDSNGTRIRNAPDTAGAILTKVPANVEVSGDELFTAIQQVSKDGKPYQLIGDQWLRVTYNGVTGWMAYIHLGQPICKNFKAIEENEPVPSPEVVYPDALEIVPLDKNNQPIGPKKIYKV